MKFQKYHHAEMVSKQQWQVWTIFLGKLTCQPRRLWILNFFWIASQVLKDNDSEPKGKFMFLEIWVITLISHQSIFYEYKCPNNWWYRSLYQLSSHAKKTLLRHPRSVVTKSPTHNTLQKEKRAANEKEMYVVCKSNEIWQTYSFSFRTIMFRSKVKYEWI